MEYPRPLRPKELDLLETVLPVDRPAYREVRDRLQAMTVLGEGRRGEGDLILGVPGDTPDRESPLPPVIAYGMVETTHDNYSVTVREEASAQINVEIVSGSGRGIPDHYEEKRRWTYSWWSPGNASPATGAPVREVPVEAGVTLAFAPAEKRIWVHERSSGIVRLIPITNYYNDLMIRRGVRDPRIALHPSLLWENLHTFPDSDLLQAFVAYNALRGRIPLRAEPRPARRSGIPLFIRQLFTRRR
ncbi:MAG TPA: hypothetical protein VMF59_14235 [Bacteroidota bacterium]|nr:hypothetical protein [Bacteroidota bacterium]